MLFLKIISSELKTRVFKKIKNSLNENGFCDLTGKEIGEEIAYSSTVVNFCIRSLVDKGILRIEKNNGKDRCKRKRHIYIIGDLNNDSK